MQNVSFEKSLEEAQHEYWYARLERLHILIHVLAEMAADERCEALQLILSRHSLVSGVDLDRLN